MLRCHLELCRAIAALTFLNGSKGHAPWDVQLCAEDISERGGLVHRIHPAALLTPPGRNTSNISRALTPFPPLTAPSMQRARCSCCSIPIPAASLCSIR